MFSNTKINSMFSDTAPVVDFQKIHYKSKPISSHSQHQRQNIEFKTIVNESCTIPV